MTTHVYTLLADVRGGERHWSLMVTVDGATPVCRRIGVDEHGRGALLRLRRDRPRCAAGGLDPRRGHGSRHTVDSHRGRAGPRATTGTVVGVEKTPRELVGGSFCSPPHMRGRFVSVVQYWPPCNLDARCTIVGDGRQQGKTNPWQ